MPAAGATRPLTTVLVVEDDGPTRARYRQILHSAGFRVIAAHSGAHALKLMEQRPFPDAIVLDLGIQGSLDLYDELRAQADAKVPVIVVTGEELSPQQQARFLFLLHKPVVPEALVFAVDNALRRSRGTSR